MYRLLGIPEILKLLLVILARKRLEGSYSKLNDLVDQILVILAVAVGKHCFSAFEASQFRQFPFWAP
jgi:hypothetical protein